ncbi:MAG: phosphoribosylanthranilate isomerase [Simkaniaceae bacterium]
MTLVKICGLTDPEEALAAALCGADFIGIIFARESKRYVDVDRALAIAKAAHKGGAKVVGVFVGHSAEEMQRIADHVGLDVVQLHGEESRKVHKELSENLIRFYVCPVSSDGFVKEENHPGFLALNKERDFLLYDGMNPGSGKPFNWDAFEPRRDFNFFLGGGLTPDNVSIAIKKKQPDGVDVASGVEKSKGKKDLQLIQAFIDEVKGD